MQSAPSKNLIVIARELRHPAENFHEAWALRLCTCFGVGNDPRYTPTTTFKLPLPTRPHAQHPGRPTAPRTRTARPSPPPPAPCRSPRPLVRTRPPTSQTRAGGRPRLPRPHPARDGKAAEEVRKTRTLTNLYNTRGTPAGAWLDEGQPNWTRQCARPYGWPADISNDDALARLLVLNLERAGTPRIVRRSAPTWPHSRSQRTHPRGFQRVRLAPERQELGARGRQVRRIRRCASSSSS